MLNYAIIKVGSFQYKVQPNDTIEVPKLDKKPGSRVSLKEVLLLHKEGKILVGCPKVRGGTVVCEVVSHRSGKKGIAFKFRRRESYRKKKGFRQTTTALKVHEIKLEKEEAS